MCIGLNRRVINNSASSGVASNPTLLNVWNAKPSAPTNEAMDLQSLLRSGLSEQQHSRKRKIPNDGKHHITVQHNYHDHANDVEVELKHVPARGGVITPFPLKLHAMLQAVEKEGLEHVVSWQPHGRCFVVRDPKAFVPILDKYFKVTKIASFQRQLNLYGFQRITKGQDKGGYYHELFLRGKVFLVQNIHRVKVKGTKIRARSNPEQEPNFYAMPYVGASVIGDMQQPSSCSVPLSQPQLSLQSLLQMQEVPSMESSIFDPVPIANMRASPWDLREAASMVIPTNKKQEASLEPLPWDTANDEDFLASDADEFFKDFDFPAGSDAFVDIEDDAVFGNLLEEIVGI